MILAAGMGSRYGGLKQVDGVGPQDEAIIEYSIYDAIRAGYGKVVFVIREDIEAVFREKFGSRLEGLIPVEYAFQAINTPIEGIDELPHREKPWGTAHAVLVAEHLIREPFAVINADDYYGISAFKTMAGFLQNQCAPDHYSMIGYVLKNTLSDHGAVNRGVCEMDSNNLLTDVVERTKIQRQNGAVYYQDAQGHKRELSETALVSMNFWGFHPNIFGIIKEDFKTFVHENRDNPKAEFFIPLVINRLIKENRVKLSVLPSADLWYGVTYREDKPRVQEAFRALVAEGRYPDPLWS